MKQGADLLAWEAICNWPKHTKVETVREGIDFALIARPLLRCKVARAMRFLDDPEYLERRGF